MHQPKFILFFCQQAEFPAAQLHLGGHQQGDGQAEDDQEQGGDRGENPESKIALTNPSPVVHLLIYA